MFRNLAAGPNKTDDQGVVPQQLLFDKNFSTSTTVQNVLPYIGVSDSGHAEDRFPTRLMDTPKILPNSEKCAVGTKYNIQNYQSHRSQGRFEFLAFKVDTFYKLLDNTEKKLRSIHFSH